MTKTDIIIIGAGASGLMAAYELVKAGKTVSVLEARNRPGGRIYTFNDQGFSQPIEGGAEFVHGKLKITRQLIKQSAQKMHSAKGEIWENSNGKLEKKNDFIEDWGLLVKRANQLEQDISLSLFLDEYFPGEKFSELRESVIAYVEGYHVAEPDCVSMFALRREWKDEEYEQFRIEGGYGTIIEYLVKKILENNGKIFLSEEVMEVNWKKGEVIVKTKNREYLATKVIIAVPLGVLQAIPGSIAAISFNPLIPEKIKALRSMGFGDAIKIILQFRNQWWSEKNMQKLGFVLSREVVPTWWTQYPEENGLLTGWVGGPMATRLKEKKEIEILNDGLSSLSRIFFIDVPELNSKLQAYKIINWATDPFSQGGYSYHTLQHENARRELINPVNNTLFFCGEYLYDGSATGTVEAALVSGKKVAYLISKA